MITCLIYDDLVAKLPIGGRRHELACGEAGLRADAAVHRVLVAEGRLPSDRLPDEAQMRAWGNPCVAVNGLIVDGPLGECLLEDGDAVLIAPRPAEASTIIMAIIAVASAVASSLIAASLASTVDVAGGNSNSPERRYAFQRFSNDAVAGDPIPVVLGKVPRYGGKVVSKLPGEGPDGDARLRMLIALSEGELAAIGGFTSDATWVDASDSRCSGMFLQDQALSTYPNCRVSVRMGTALQSPIPGFDDIELLREVGVGGAVLANTSGAVRTGGSPSAEAVVYGTLDVVNGLVLRVNFRRGLYSLSGTGQVNARTARYRWRWRTSDVGAGAGTWSGWTVVTITRAEQSQFVAAQRLDGLVSGAGAKVDVQAERVSIEPSRVQDADEMTFDSVIEVRAGDLNYAGVALLGLELVASEQLTSVPRVGCDLSGAKVRRWDGVSPTTAPVYTTGGSNNPADLALELLSNTVWGAGGIYGDAAVDLESLFAWRTYCAETVAVPPAFGGGTRPRFACNIVLDRQADVIEQLRTICLTGRCTPVSSGNVWRFTVDRERTNPVEVFGDGDIACSADGEAMVEVSRDLAAGGVAKANRISGTFASERSDGRTDNICFPEYGQLWLADEQVREESVKLDGVTNPHQAACAIVYDLKRKRGINRSIKFTTIKPVLSCQPGDLIYVSTSVVGYGAASGRIDAAASTAAALVLDRDVMLAAGSGNIFEVRHADNTLAIATVTLGVDTLVPAGTPVALDAVLAAAPADGATYSFGAPGKSSKPYLCAKVTPSDSGSLTWEVEAVEYAAGVYDDAPGDIVLPDYATPSTNATPPGPVTTLRAIERTVAESQVVELVWSQQPADAAITETFRVYRRLVGTLTWVLAPDLRTGRRGYVLDISDTDLGHEFVVVAVTSGGAALSPYDPRHPISSVVIGLAGEAPPEPTGLTITRETDGSYTLAWDAVETAAGYAVYTFGADGTEDYEDYRNLQPIARTTDPTLGGLQLSADTAYTFGVRSVGANGRLSKARALVTVSPTGVPTGYTLNTAVDHDLLAGTLTNLDDTGPGGALELVNPLLPGVYLSELVTFARARDARIAVRPLCIDLTGDWAMSEGYFTVPSIAADAWGVVSTSPLLVGLMTPPYPESVYGIAVEIRTFDGTEFTAWRPLAACTDIRQLMAGYQIRITLKPGVAPYRLAIAAVQSSGCDYGGL